MITFNEPPRVPQAYDYIRNAIESGNVCGDGPYTKRCSEWIEQRFDVQKSLLTTSGTAALEMAALLCRIKPGDEVILPSVLVHRDRLRAGGRQACVRGYTPRHHEHRRRSG